MTQETVTLKALSLSQPWATLMAVGAKKIETRAWPMRHRGPLVICATAQPLAGVLSLLKYGTSDAAWKILHALRSAGYDGMEELPYGAALCVVEVYDCRPADSVGSRLEEIEDVVELSFGDYRPNRWAILTRNLRRLPAPVPCRGRLGVWDLELPAAMLACSADHASSGAPGSRAS
jgi:hypothetical protein